MAVPLRVQHCHKMEFHSVEYSPEYGYIQLNWRFAISRLAQFKKIRTKIGTKSGQKSLQIPYKKTRELVKNESIVQEKNKIEYEYEEEPK